MASLRALKVLLKAAHALPLSKSALQRLRLARRIALAAEELERAAVTLARAEGHTWAEIGEQFGMSKQAAQQRFRSAPPVKKAPGRKRSK